MFETSERLRLGVDCSFVIDQSYVSTFECWDFFKPCFCAACKFETIDV